MMSLRWWNKKYGDHLAEQIKTFEPKFSWLGRDFNFKYDVPQVSFGNDLNNKRPSDLEKMITEQREKNNQEGDIRNERFETESDVVLSSVSEVPQEIGFSDSDQSQYEEFQKGPYSNFRSYRFGRKPRLSNYR